MTSDILKDLKNCVLRLDTCAVYMREHFPAEAGSIDCQVKRMTEKYNLKDDYCTEEETRKRILGGE